MGARKTRHLAVPVDVREGRPGEKGLGPGDEAELACRPEEGRRHLAVGRTCAWPETRRRSLASVTRSAGTARGRGPTDGGQTSGDSV